MSWITFNVPVVLTTKKPLKVCKIIKKDNHSLYYNYYYEKGYDNKKRNISFNNEYCCIESDNGYHSFSTDFILKENKAYARNLMKLYDVIDDNSKIILCEIPKDTKYCVNEFGEYISEKLIYLEDL